MKVIVTVIILLLTAATTTKLYATAQYPDKIIYNGKEYSLHTNPLEAYFEKHPDQRPKGGIQSTALWRGYVATFEIKDNQLYLSDIKIENYKDSTGKSYETTWKSVLSTIFPGQKEIKVDWLTGLLVLPYGKIVNYVHMGYGSTYENYILLEIEKGNFVKEKKFGYKEYAQFKDRQFLVFKQTAEYRKLKEDLKKDGTTEEFIDRFLHDFVIDYTTKILED